MNMLLAVTATTAAIPSSTGPMVQTGTNQPSWDITLLDELMARIGVDGLVAMLRSPALLATVRAHGVAVRDTLAARGHAVSSEALAGYASVVLTAGLHCGQLLPTDPDGVDWSSADWYLLRLVAVCAVATELDGADTLA
jgi:hypothetical protein